MPMIQGTICFNPFWNRINRFWCRFILSQHCKLAIYGVWEPFSFCTIHIWTLSHPYPDNSDHNLFDDMIDRIYFYSNRLCIHFHSDHIDAAISYFYYYYLMMLYFDYLEHYLILTHFQTIAFLHFHHVQISYLHTIPWSNQHSHHR